MAMLQLAEQLQKGRADLINVVAKLLLLREFSHLIGKNNNSIKEKLY